MEEFLIALGNWKAEKFRKFCFPASEYVLGGSLLDKLYDAWIVLVRIVEMIYCCGRNVITMDMLKLLERHVEA